MHTHAENVGRGVARILEMGGKKLITVMRAQRAKILEPKVTPTN